MEICKHLSLARFMHVILTVPLQCALCCKHLFGSRRSLEGFENDRNFTCLAVEVSGIESDSSD